jgi:deazaflavin-dependent oxidoreductase (nitroreductase family)
MEYSHVSQPLRRIASVFGPLALPIAIRGYVTFWAVLRHRGRRSGRAYATPVAIARTPDGFIVPMPFGETDWYRNVRAAGGCTVVWRGAEWDLTDPAVIAIDEASPHFSTFQRPFLRILGIQRFLRVRDVTTGQVRSGARHVARSAT